MNKISIITICFNCVGTIEDTILSVINQKYNNLEYIIIDGGSFDGTVNIIKKYIDKISYFISEPDKGISDAFNKGINVATGEIIGIINAGDFLYKDALLNIDEFCRKNDYDIITGNMIAFEDGKQTGRLKISDIDFSKLEYTFNIFHPSTFIKKAAYQKYGCYSLDYKIAMDFELISKMYFSGASIKHINKTLSCFRLGGISGKTRKTMSEHKIVALKNGTSKIKLLWFCLSKRYIPNIVFKILKKAHVYYYLRNKIKPQEEIPVKWWEV